MNNLIRHALDLKDESIFRNPNALNVTFYDMKKFDQVNSVIGKLGGGGGGGGITMRMMAITKKVQVEHQEGCQ